MRLYTRPADVQSTQDIDLHLSGLYMVASPKLSPLFYAHERLNRRLVPHTVRPPEAEPQQFTDATATTKGYDYILDQFRRSQAELAKTKAELADAMERIRQLEADDGQVTSELLGYRSLGLTPKESSFLGVLMAHDKVSKERVFTVLYGNNPGGDMPSEEVLSVYTCKIGQKLKVHDDIKIKTIWGWGWAIDAENKERVRNAVARHSGEARPDQPNVSARPLRRSVNFA